MNKELRINYQEFEHYRSLTEREQTLVSNAYLACENAYAPYSKFHVGAVLLLEDGTEVVGNNQENIAYPSGLCAERVALFYAGANFPGTRIETLVVVATGDLIQPNDCVSPCGSCRQVIAESEFRQKAPMKIILVSQTGRTFVFERGTDLLVFAFGMH
ncbi:MAG: cytidine deaminase [Crocinitomicaceae bacterium]|nr:MAG: cytidine deaminase [Crocinitomicaceae bacterium]